MLTSQILDNQGPFPYDGKPGVPLAWVIGEDVLFERALNYATAIIFLEADQIIDISNEYPENDGITVKFLKNEEEMERLHTSEYFGSILLSSPKIVNLLKHKRGGSVMSPAKFINNEFYVTDGRDNSLIADWLPNLEPSGGICDGEMCGCQN